MKQQEIDTYRLFHDLNVSRETFEKLQEYIRLLIRWNQSINLISKKDIDDIWTKHIIICAELIKYIEDKGIILVDLGSGAGLPGIILSIMGVRKTILIESNSKKAAFLLQASRISDFSVEIINDRIEKQNISCDVVTSRALASVKELVKYNKYINFKKFMLLIKGPNAYKEVENVKDCEVMPSIYDPLSNIVLVRCPK